MFTHSLSDATVKIVQGFNDEFNAPHSRYTTVSSEEIRTNPNLTLLAESDDAGAFIIISNDEKHIMITGHLEYDAGTLAEEYERDVAKGIKINVPENYFPNDDPENTIKYVAISYSFTLFELVELLCISETPFEWNEMRCNLL